MVESLIQNISYFFLASGLITWLIRSIFLLYFNKDLETFKYKLKQEHTKFSKLHEDRAKVIKELYFSLVDFETKINSLIKPFQWAGEASEEEKEKLAREAGNNFDEMCLKNRIYFSEETCVTLDKINKEFREAWVTFGMKKYDEKKKIDYWIKAWNKLGKDIPKLKSDLERDFRGMLGVK